MADLSFLQLFTLPFVFKILLLVLMGGFTIFSLVVLNQIRVMNNIIHFGFPSHLLGIVALIFIIASAMLFLLGLAIL